MSCHCHSHFSFEKRIFKITVRKLPPFVLFHLLFLVSAAYFVGLGFVGVPFCPRAPSINATTGISSSPLFKVRKGFWPVCKEKEKAAKPGRRWFSLGQGGGADLSTCYGGRLPVCAQWPLPENYSHDCKVKHHVQSVRWPRPQHHFIPRFAWQTPADVALSGAGWSQVGHGPRVEPHGFLRLNSVGRAPCFPL